VALVDRRPSLVWNKGIAARCDRRIPDEFPDGHTNVPTSAHAGNNVLDGGPELIEAPERFEDIGGGELVWVRAAWLPAFVAQVLPRIRDDFILVTGDSDSSLPSSAPQVAAALFACPHLVHWYAQNHDGIGPPGRCSPVPIGLDFHTLSEPPSWGEPVTPPAAQEAQLLTLAASLPPVRERDLRCHLDRWSMHPTPPPAGSRVPETRVEVARLLLGQPHIAGDPPLRRTELWRRRARYAASASPHGAGLDAHRTWEGLALGQVVVVPTSSLDPLFEGLRAVPISSWRDLTAANLRRWVDRLAELPHPSPVLTSEHWVERMRRGATSAGSRPSPLHRRG
jgi:hypothetical protein